MLSAKWWRVRRLYQKALRYHRAGRLPQAAALCQDAIRLDPSYVWAYLLQGQIHIERRHHGQARQLFLKALEIRDQAESHYHLGAVALRSGVWEQAQNHYEQLIAFLPQFAEGYRGLGIALLRQGELRRARVCFETAFNLKPEDARQAFNIAVTERMYQYAMLQGGGQWPTDMSLQTYLELGIVLLEDELYDTQAVGDDFNYTNIALSLKKLYAFVRACNWPITVVMPADEASLPLALVLSKKLNCSLIVDAEVIRRYDGVLFISANAQQHRYVMEELGPVYAASNLVWHFALNLVNLRGWSWESLPHIVGTLRNPAVLPWDDEMQYQCVDDTKPLFLWSEGDFDTEAQELLRAWDELDSQGLPIVNQAQEFVIGRRMTNCPLDLSLCLEDLYPAVLLWFGWQKIDAETHLSWDRVMTYRMVVHMEGEVEQQTTSSAEWERVESSEHCLVMECRMRWEPPSPMNNQQPEPFASLCRYFSGWCYSGTTVKINLSFYDEMGGFSWIPFHFVGLYNGKSLSLNRIGTWESPGWSLWQFMSALKIAQRAQWRTPKLPLDLVSGRKFWCESRSQAQSLAVRLEPLLGHRHIKEQGNFVVGEFTPDEMGVIKSWLSVGKMLHQAKHKKTEQPQPVKHQHLPPVQLFGFSGSNIESDSRLQVMLWGWMTVLMLLATGLTALSMTCVIWSWTSWHHLAALPVVFAGVINLALIMLYSAVQPHSGLLSRPPPRMLVQPNTLLNRFVVALMVVSAGYWLQESLFATSVRLIEWWPGFKWVVVLALFIAIAWLIPAVVWLCWGDRARFMSRFFYCWPMPYVAHIPYYRSTGVRDHSFPAPPIGLLRGVGWSCVALWCLLCAAHLKLPIFYHELEAIWVTRMAWSFLGAGVLFAGASFFVLPKFSQPAFTWNYLRKTAWILAFGVMLFGLFLGAQLL